MKRAVLYLLAFVVALTLPLSLSDQPLAAATTVTVDPTIQYQTLEGWGTSLAWFAHVLGGAPDATRNNFADLLFDSGTGLGRESKQRSPHGRRGRIDDCGSQWDPVVE